MQELLAEKARKTPVGKRISFRPGREAMTRHTQMASGQVAAEGTEEGLTPENRYATRPDCRESFVRTVLLLSRKWTEA